MKWIIFILICILYIIIAIFVQKIYKIRIKEQQINCRVCTTLNGYSTDLQCDKHKDDPTFIGPNWGIIVIAGGIYYLCKYIYEIGKVLWKFPNKFFDVASYKINYKYNTIHNREKY